MASEIVEQDQLLLVNSLLPVDVGLFRQKITYTCLHVEGSILAVGSEQGLVWIVDTNSKRIVRELSESRAPVAVVRVASDHSFVAIGFHDGVLAVVNYLKPSVKQMLQEKEKSSITAMAWSSDGGRLIIGYKSGKLLSASFDSEKGGTEVSPLLECGSEVVQLSLRGSLLVVSTLDRPLLLNVNTGQLTQVGSRDRKAGPYGGCFTSKDSIVIARPGLRLWIAAADGKVQSTAKFKELLAGDLPPMSLYGGIVTTTTFNDGWQFGTILPWINQWVVCCQGNTVLVLEPHNLKCIGAMTLGQKIVDFGTCENDIYMLLQGHQRMIVKLSFVLPKDKRIPAINVLAPMVDEEQTEAERGSEKDATEEKQMMNETEEEAGIKDKEVTCFTDKALSRDSEETDNVERDGPVPTENNQLSTTLEEPVSSDGPPLLNATIESFKDGDTEGNEDNKENEGRAEKGPMKVLSAVESRLNQVVDLTGKLSNPLGKLNLTRHDFPRNPKEEEKDEPLPTIPLSTDEMERRVQMLNIPDDDSGIAVHTQTVKKKKKRKTRKHKEKITPTSSTHSSMERLDHVLGMEANTPVGTESVASTPGDLEKERNYFETVPMDQEKIEINPPETGIIDKVKQTSPPVIDAGAVENCRVEDKELETKVEEKRPESTKEMAEEASMETQGIGMEAESNGVKSDIAGTGTVIGENDTVSCEVVKPEITDGKPVNVTSVDSEDFPTASTSEQFLLDTIDRIWSSGETEASQSYEKAGTPETPKEELQPDSLVGNRESRDRVTRGRANAVHINYTEVLFKSSSKDDLFGEGGVSESADDGGLLTFLSGMEAGDDATLTRTSVKSSNIHVDQTPKNSLNTTSTVDQGSSPIGDEALTESHRSSHSHSVSSSYSLEEASSHPLFSGTSDTESEEEDDPFRGDRHESVIASDYYSLVGGLVGDMSPSTEKTPGDMTFHGRRERAKAFVPPFQEEREQDEPMDLLKADKWETIPQPSKPSIQSICLSSTSLWLINAKNSVFWSHATQRGVNWQGLKKRISFLSSSADGRVVWGVHHCHAYARHGITDSNPVGTTWFNVTRNGPVSKNIKYISCDHDGVWAITTDGKVLFRRGVSEKNPEGTVWIEVKTSNHFVQISCNRGIVWALESSGRAYVRENVNDSTPAGNNWRDIKSPSFAAISVLENGIVWGIDLNNRLWFHCGATSFEPEGGGHWFEVAIGSLSKQTGSRTGESMWKVRSTELRSNSFLHSVTSRFVPSNTNQFLALSACAQSGICLLTSDNELHTCWNAITGYHHEPACTDPLFDVSTWVQVTTSNTVLWAVRDDGELYCIPSPDKSYHIECEGRVSVLSASPSAVWVVSNNVIWSRQGICEEIPQGYSWEYIELGSHMHDLNIKHLAIGKNVAWALDDRGKLHFRFGIHPREPGTGMSPAWIQVEDQQQNLSLGPQPVFESIVVGPDDWLVWALDQQGTPYCRQGVTTDFPVGKSWETVKGEKIRALAAASSKIFAISTSGKLLCRRPITECLPCGIYWRKLPGKFDVLSASPSGDLWLIGDKGIITRQKSKVVMHSLKKSQKEREALEQGYEEDWDVL